MRRHSTLLSRPYLFARGLVGFALPFLLATSYTLNVFYTEGAPVWDAGWFAWLAAHATGWTLPNPPAIGGDFLAIHVSPIFVLLSAAKSILPLLPDAVWFALTQGLWFGLLGLAAALSLPPLAAVLTAFNGIVLATIGFPHIEIAMPALLFLAIVLRARGAWFLPVLLVMACVREDAALHAALAFAALAVLRARALRSIGAGFPDFVVTLLCLGAGFAALALQHTLPGGGAALSGTYLGTPPLAHVDGAFLQDRLHYLFKDRAYVWGPLLLLALVAMSRRDLRLGMGVLICLPWLALSLVAQSHQAGEMWSYYSVPVMVGLCWPMLMAASFDDRTGILATLQAVMAILSILLFIGSGGNHDRRPWNHIIPTWNGRIASTETALDDILARRAELAPLIVDDATAALRLGAFSADELRYDFKFTDAELQAAQTLVLRPGGKQSDAMTNAITRSGLTEPEAAPLEGDGGFRILHRPPPPAAAP